MGLTVYVDGCTLNNHIHDKSLRKSYIAIVVKTNDKEILKKVYACPANTNNEAEFFAMMMGILTASKIGADISNMQFISDSKLVVNSVRQTNVLRNEHLIKHLAKLQEIMETNNVRMTQIFWHPRENNPAGHLLDAMRCQNALPLVKEAPPKSLNVGR